MPGTMSRADLAVDLKASLQDAASVFTAAADADYSRHLDVAALDFSRFRPRTALGSITLVAGTADYAGPAGLISYKGDIWSAGKMPAPWEPHYPGRLPLVQVLEVSGARRVLFTPAPTALQIALFGSTFTFYYFAAHAVGTLAADTTIHAGDRNLLILRAQAEAMRELAMRAIAKPVQLRDGMSGQAKNGTPAGLYHALLDEFERAADRKGVPA